MLLLLLLLLSAVLRISQNDYQLRAKSQEMHTHYFIELELYKMNTYKYLRVFIGKSCKLLFQVNHTFTMKPKIEVCKRSDAGVFLSQ